MLDAVKAAASGATFDCWEAQPENKNMATMIKMNTLRLCFIMLSPLEIIVLLVLLVKLVLLVELVLLVKFVKLVLLVVLVKQFNWLY